MRRYNLPVFLFILIAAIVSCKSQDDTIHNFSSIEQRALDVFRDSVLLKPIWKKDSTGNTIVDHPNTNTIDSIWVSKGVFYGYKLYASKYATKFSKAYIDTLTFIENEDIFTDSAKTEIMGFWKYIENSLASDTTKVALTLPESFSVGTFDDFLKRKLSNEIYIQVNKAIKSKATEMVQIKAYKHSDGYTLYSTFTFWFFVDRKNNSVNWSFF